MKFNFICNRTALHIAVETKNKEIIKLLVKQKGIKLNLKDEV